MRQQDALARLSTRGRHIVASNSGHWVPLDQPSVVIEAIENMLDEVSPTATASAAPANPVKRGRQ
jgi:hypothetical protein